MKIRYPRTMIGLLASVLWLLAMAQPAHAATGTSQVGWVNPTARTDGSPMAASEITGYSFLCTFTPTSSPSVPCSGLTPLTITTGPQTTVSTTMTYPASGGTACYQVIVKTAGADADASDITPLSCKTFAAVKPNKATAVTITVTISAVLGTEK